MPQHCRTCNHPKLLEINDDLLNRVPYNIVAKKYNLAYDSVIRHARNHLVESVKEWREKTLKRQDSKLSSTLEFTDSFLEYFKNHQDELLKQMTVSNFLKVLEFRSTLLGEQKSPPAKVEIVWGAGLEDADAMKRKAFVIRMPVKANVKRKEEEKDERTVDSGSVN